MSLPTLQKNLYGNWVMNGPDGAFMSRIDTKRAHWYLRRNLATVTGDTTIQINFVAKGPGHLGSVYYSAPKENRCVVCGTYDNLTRHHVVPHTYRKFFPDEFKSRSSHDIVIICDECHEIYEQHHAIRLTKKIAKEMGFPVDMGNHKNSASPEEKAKSLARIFLGREMPPHRKEEVQWRIENLLKREGLTREDIVQIANTEIKSLRRGKIPKGTKTHWSEVVRVLAETKQIAEFIRRWRQDFVDHAKPKFLPVGWSVDHEGTYRVRDEIVSKGD